MTSQLPGKATAMKEWIGMDNHSMAVTSRGKGTLALALQVAFAHSGPATGYRVDHALGFVLFWTRDESAVPFPCPLDAEGATDLIWRWLSSLKDEQFQGWLEPDGSNERGWCAHNDAWGHAGSHFAFIAVKPVWAWLGK